MSTSSVCSEDNNDKVTMWTLVHKAEDDEYDCVPNQWLISAEQCYYPEGETVSNLKRMAKLGTSPEIDWPVKAIKIIKRDFENFDRCVMDACRMQNNKRTLTSSEDELNKRRPSKANHKYQDFQPLLGQSQQENLKKKKNIRKAIEFSKMPSFSKEVNPQEASETGLHNLTAETAPFRTPSPLLKTRKLSYNPSVESASKTSGLAQRKSGCHLPPKLKHTCIFERGAITTENLAMQLCSISRSIFTLTEEVKNLTAEISSRLLADDRPTTQKRTVESDSGSDIENDDISQQFPFVVLENLMAFNDTLKDLEHQKKTAQVFKNILSSCETKSYSRATTTLLRTVIGPNVTGCFTWKGHARKGHTSVKRPFSQLALCKLIIHVVKKKYGLKESCKIKKTIAAWLSQTESKKSREQRLGDGVLDVN